MTSFRLELRIAFPNHFCWLPKSASTTRSVLLVRSGTKRLVKRCEIGIPEGYRNAVVTKAVTNGNDKATADDDGVSLATMKLPPNTDLAKFETLLFQWGNSISQGADTPLPMPLKVDKIKGGARLGFVTMEDGKTKVYVYIDCIVSTHGGVGPMFRAIRNGPLRVQSPPGEPRIMKSLLPALRKSIDIATDGC